MNVLVTGAAGFVGAHLCAALEKKDISTGRIVHATSRLRRRELCSAADMVVHLAAVNRPGEGESYVDNVTMTRCLLADILASHHAGGAALPSMLFASSIQASLQGRFSGSRYGISKLECERLLSDCGRRYGFRVMNFRLPNLYGSGCRPFYNSVVATFCHCIPRGIPIRIDNPDQNLRLLHIDDLTSMFLRVIISGENLSDADFMTPTVTVSVGLLAATVERLCDGEAPHTVFERHLSEILNADS